MRSTSTRDQKAMPTTPPTSAIKPAATGAALAAASNKLEVTVIPVDDEPFSKTIIIPSSMIGKYRFCDISTYKLQKFYNLEMRKPNYALFVAGCISYYIISILINTHQPTFLYLYRLIIISIFIWWSKWIFVNTFSINQCCQCIIILIPKLKRYLLGKRKSLEKHFW